jgi:hypothetical protein
MKGVARATPFTFSARGRAPLLIAAFAVLALSIEALLRRPEDWQNVYLPAGRALLEGRDVYDLETSRFPYPPAMALAAAAFSAMPSNLGRLAWVLSNAAALVVFWWCSWRAAGGRTVTGWRDGAPLAFGMVVGFRFVTDVIEHQQTDLWIAALVALTAFSVTRRWWHRAALAAGLAAALKATPLLWAGYFLVRRRWTAAALMLAVLFAASLLPDLLSHPPAGGIWLERWARVVLLQSIGAPGPWLTAPVYNQGLAGTIHRLGALAWPGPGAFASASVLDPTLSANAIRWTIRFAQAAVATIGAAALVAGSEDLDAAGTVPPGALDSSIVMMLMVLLSPASSKPHFLIVLLPACCLARAAFVGGNRVDAAFLALALGASLVSNRALVGDAIGQPAQWAGAITLCALALLLGCSWARLRGEDRVPAHPGGTRRSCLP